MDIVLSWHPLNGTAPEEIVQDLSHAMGLDQASASSDFTNPYDPFTGLRLANVIGGNLQRVNDLGQTLLTLSDGRFSFVLSYSPRGNFMTASSDMSQATCDALTEYRK